MILQRWKRDFITEVTINNSLLLLAIPNWKIEQKVFFWKDAEFYADFDGSDESRQFLSLEIVMNRAEKR